jgi:hypothetical protein
MVIPFSSKNVRFCLELDLLYVDALIRRWQRRTKRGAIHLGSGESFAAREAFKAGQGKSTSEMEG